MRRRVRGRLTCVQADGSIGHEHNLVDGWRIDKFRSGLAVLVEQCGKVIADELVRPTLVENLIVPQPIFNVPWDCAKGAVVQVAIVPVKKKLAVPEALAEVQGQLPWMN